MKPVVSYLAYAAFAIVLFFAWVLLALFVFLNDYGCHYDPSAAGCGSWVVKIGYLVMFFGMPISALAFIPFRRWIRRVTQAQDRTWQNPNDR